MSAPRALLERLMLAHHASQILLFGPAGEPFLAARIPLTIEEIDALDGALGLLVQLESERPRPFVHHDVPRALTVGALDEAQELFFVIFHRPAGPPPEAAAAALRAALLGV